MKVLFTLIAIFFCIGSLMMTAAINAGPVLALWAVVAMLMAIAWEKK
jgi:hypothetical protein